MANAGHLRFPSGMAARLAVQRCIMPIVSVAPGTERSQSKRMGGGATKKTGRAKKKRARNDLDLFLLGDFLADSIMVNHHNIYSLYRGKSALNHHLRGICLETCSKHRGQSQIQFEKLCNLLASMRRRVYLLTDECLIPMAKCR